MEIGKVIHFYDKISVAVVELMKPLHVNDRVVFRGHTTEFEQEVGSLQIDHQNLEMAGIGQQVAIKVEDRVRCGDKVLAPEDD